MMTSTHTSEEEISSIVEGYRSPYESQTEWELRRNFMIANYRRVNMESLVCLANCYLNVEMYGCRYPALVMGQIREMSSSLNTQRLNPCTSKTENLPKRMKGVETVQFVRQSDTETAKEQKETPISTKVSSADKQSTKNSQEAAKKTTTKPNFHFVKASSDFHSTDVATESIKQKLMKEEFMASCQPQPVVDHLSAQNPNQKSGLGFVKKEKLTDAVGPEMPTNSFIIEIDNQFHAFSNHYATYKKNHPQRSPIDIFHMAAMKTRMKIDTQFNDVSVKGQNKFTCTVVIDNVDIATAEDSNKKGAKNKAFEIGQEKLSRKYIKVVRVNPEKQELQAFDEEPKSDPGFIKTETEEIPAPKTKPVKRKESELHGDLTRFIIFETANTTQNAISVLKTSADMNHADLEYDFHPDMSGTRCRVLLDGHNLVEYMGTTKASSKSVASEKALERLKQICWTIKIKQAVDASESEVSRDKVMGEIQKQVSTISDDNIGSRLLKKMGWTGGGVGARGNKGLAEPVAVTMTNHVLLNREGLGLHGDHAKAMVDFKKKITEVIDNYTKSEKQEDLAFSPEFSKEERAFIHQYSQKLGLKTQSRGTGSERYLTISRKRSVSQLFDHIMEEGGATHKYELIPPLYD